MAIRNPGELINKRLIFSMNERVPGQTQKRHLAEIQGITKVRLLEVERFRSVYQAQED